MTPNAGRPIALVGLMGAGKSSVARLLGERLGVSVADLDAMIEAVEGCTVAELFERSGEGWFRRREGELLDEVLASGVQVIACGGGIVLDPARRARLRERCLVVWLEVAPATAARRVAASGGDPARVRPLLAGAGAEARLTALLAERAPLYAEVAALRVPTDALTPEQVAERILAPKSASS
ncbi:MAG TPA: shikimate kinase [Candidatus Acidoferrales bacterium]|nr:shikimate kinase [Candidatus Acidoferrales bacterium]